jgi:hypothetical protein
MEACGVALSIFLLERISRRPSTYGYFGLGLVCAIFLTSRYSFICTVLATGIAAAWTLRYLHWKRKITCLAAFCLPVFISCAGIYLITLSHQNPGSKLPDYVQSYILHGKTLGQMLSISANALLTPSGIGLTQFVGTFLFCYGRRIKAAHYELFTTYFVFVVSISVVYIILSLLGKYPWCPEARWGISLNLIAMFSWFTSMLMLAYALGVPERFGRDIFCSAMSLAIAFIALSRALTVTLATDDSIYENISALGPTQFYGKQVLVVTTAQATLRYLYEYGPLKKYAAGSYPDSFVFEKEYCSKQKWELFDFVIFSHMSDEEIRSQLGDAVNKFVVVGTSTFSPIYRSIPEQQHLQ